MSAVVSAHGTSCDCGVCANARADFEIIEHVERATAAQIARWLEETLGEYVIAEWVRRGRWRSGK